MKKSVFGLASSEEQARKVVDRLMSAGFTNEDISFLSSDHRKTKTSRMDEMGEVEMMETKGRRGPMTTEKNTKAPEGAAAGATAGGLFGGSIGLLAGLGSLAIPGVGPFIAAGPIMAALSGSALGGGLGLLLGALAGAGMPEYEAVRYKEGVMRGDILLSVHAENDEELNQATEIMKKEGVKDIATSSEKSKSHR